MGLYAMILVFWMLSFKPTFYSPLSLSSRGPLVLSGECVVSSVLSHCSKNLKWQTSVTVQFYLASKRKYIFKTWGWANPKESLGSILAPLFQCFFSSPWVCPIQIGLAMRAVCFTWGSHSGPWTFLCCIFMGFFLYLSFSYLYFRLLFPILTT